MSQTTPITPSRNSAQHESTANSTPTSRSIASASQHIHGQHTLYDVQKTKPATLRMMLHTLTRRICNDPQKAKPEEMFQKILTITSKIVNEFSPVASPPDGEHTAAPMTAAAEQRKQRIKELKSFHHEFVIANKEDAVYSPWVNMTNTALSLLRNETVDQVREYNKEIDLILQHNDPNLLRYKHNSQESSRKPDSIFMTTSTARALHDVPPEAKCTDAEWIEFAKKWATSRPKRSTLNWDDALSSVEYRRHNARAVDLQDTTMPEANSFVMFSSPSIFWNRGGAKSQKTTHSDSPHRSTPRTGPSHSEQTATSGPNLHQSPALPMTDWTKSVAIQSAEYALNSLCCSFDITHTFTFILIDTTLYVSWYDHEGIITTDGFDVAKYPSHYLALLFILQRFNRSDWGRCGHSLFGTMPHGDQTSHEVKINDKTFLVDLTQDGLVHKGWAIGGRSSCLRTCQMKEGDSWSKQKYVIKFSWKEGTQVSEGEIMRHIREKAANEPKVLNFIPEFITDVIFSDISTNDIRKSLEIPSNPREFVVVVMAKLDGTIMGLTGDDLWNVFWDCFRCHYHLWKLGIHHRDISTGNLMYRRDENGHAYGTLSDFDLSSLRGEPSNNKQRTGTLPFMAIELLSARGPIVHKYEYDVQSFYWVELCAVLCAKDGRADCPMRDWGNLGMEALSEKKNHYISTSQFQDEFQPAETRQIDFRRFLGVESAVCSQIRAQERLFVEHWIRARGRLGVASPTNSPRLPPLDVDEVYETLEKEHSWGVENFPLDKVRPEIPGHSWPGHNSSMM